MSEVLYCNTLSLNREHNDATCEAVSQLAQISRKLLLSEGVPIIWNGRCVFPALG